MRRLGWIAGLTCLALPRPAAPQACSGPDQRLSQLPDPFRSIRAVIGYGGTGFDLAERANRSPCLAQRYGRFVSNDMADYTEAGASDSAVSWRSALQIRTGLPIQRRP